MCGRYTVFTEEEIIEMRAIVEEVSRRYGNQPVSTGEIFPTNTVPVIAAEGGTWGLRPVKWGFPKWDGKGTIINARCETALERPMFKKSLLERRCVIPSTGFYEWMHAEGQKKKDKYLLRLPDTKMLYMAGMTNTFKDALGNRYEAFTILTTAASPSVAAIHDRMPVILKPEEQEAWLRDNGFMQEVLERNGPELLVQKVS